MKHNTVYMPVDAIAKGFENQEDFEVWYADGETFMSMKSTWENDRSPIRLFGRMGGEMGKVQLDPQRLMYYLRVERWEYVFHTLYIHKQYYVKGMGWDVFGSLEDDSLDYVMEDTGVKEVRIRRVKDFKGRGPCYEIKVKDVAAMRIAVAAVVAQALKEELKGLSEGIADSHIPWYRRVKNWILPHKGFTYEELMAAEAEIDDKVAEQQDMAKTHQKRVKGK